jgi:hypothetical protein
LLLPFAACSLFYHPAALVLSLSLLPAAVAPLSHIVHADRLDWEGEIFVVNWQKIWGWGWWWWLGCSIHCVPALFSQPHAALTEAMANRGLLQFHSRLLQHELCFGPAWKT